MLLKETQIGYHDFFAQLRTKFSPSWRDRIDITFDLADDSQTEILVNWRNLYQRLLNSLPVDEMEKIAQNLQTSNPKTALLRPVIESIWEPIANEDNWQPFNDLVKRLQSGN